MTLAETLKPKAPPLCPGEGGIIHVAGTRVTLDTIVACYKLGMTAEEIATAYDTLSLADVHAVLSYYLDNQGIVDEYIASGERESEQLHRELDAKSPWPQLRERLVARRAAGGLEQR